MRTSSIKWPSFSFLILAIISVCHLLCLNAWLLACALYGLEINTAFEDCLFLQKYIKLGALASTCNCVRTWAFCCNLELLHTRLLEDAGRTQGRASSTQWYSGRQPTYKVPASKEFPVWGSCWLPGQTCTWCWTKGHPPWKGPANTHIPFLFSLWEGLLATLVLNPHLSRGSLSTRKKILHYLLDQLDSKELSENVFLLSFLSKSK